jgi:hypothetical protein
LQGLRSWPVKGFPAIRIYSLVQDGKLIVVRVLHGKRDLGPILEMNPDEAGTVRRVAQEPDE